MKENSRLLLILQILFYLCAVGLGFVLSGIYPAVYITKLICISASFTIKLYSESIRQNWRQLLELQLGFFMVYLMTAFQLVFMYQVTSLILNSQMMFISFTIIIVSAANYSLFTNKKSISTLQFIIYSIGILCQMCINVWGTIQTIQLFYQLQGGQKIQSYILLTMSTIISIGAAILQKIYNAWKQSRLVSQQRQIKRQIQMQLQQSITSR